MKKLFASRWAPLMFIAVVFVASVAGLSYMAKKTVADNAELQQLKKDLAAARQQKAVQDANTTKPPETVKDVVQTPVAEKEEKEREQIDRTIDNSFAIINALAEPGELKFDNRALTALVEALTRQHRQQQAREAELFELEAHLKDQLDELHWHTNRLAKSQTQLDNLFETQYDLYRQQEVAKLQNLARIYESMLSPEQPNPEASMLAALKANQEVDPKLNAKVFQFVTPANQARIMSFLVDGDAADVPLYKDIIASLMKSMPAPGVKPPAPPTP